MSKAVIFAETQPNNWTDELVSLPRRARSQSLGGGRGREEQQYDQREKVSDERSDNNPFNFVKSVDVIAVGGNPGAFRQTVVQSDDNDIAKEPKIAYVKNLNNNAFYDPSASGPITSVECSFDVLNVDISKLTKVQYSLLIQQDGVLYESPRAKVPRKKEWRGFVLSNLNCEDFDRVYPPTNASGRARHPNFQSGSLIQVGYLVRVSAKATAVFAISGIDNWRVTFVTKKIDMGKSKELAKSLLVERNERQKLELQLKEEREKAETLLKQSRMVSESQDNSTTPTTTPKAAPLTAEGADAKCKQYVAVVRAAQMKLRETQQRYRDDKAAWEKARAELREQQESMAQELKHEREARSVADSMLSSQISEMASVHIAERENMTKDISEKEGMLDKYRERINQVERELRKECSLRAAADAAVGELRETEARLREVSTKLEACAEQLKLELAESLEQQVRNKLQLEELQDQVLELKDSAAREERGKYELSHELDDCRGKYQAAVMALQKEKSQLESCIAESREEIAQLKEKLAQNDHDRQQILESQAMVRNQLEHSALQQELKDREMAAQMEHLKAELEAVTNEMIKSSEGHEQKLEEMRNEVHTKQREAHIIQEQLQEETSQRIALEGKFSLLQAENEKMAKELRALREKNVTLEADVAQVQLRHEAEREMKERVASEMMGTLNVRKQVEEGQERKIAQLIEQLRAAQQAQQDAEDQIEIERTARIKAEAALGKLDEIFGSGMEAGLGADGVGELDWELLDEELGEPK